MRLMFGPKKSTVNRSRQRGVAALEFALLLPILIMLSLCTLDYGYYFWVGINATEAARAASMTASSQAATKNAGAGITLCTDLTVPSVVTAAQTAATDYMKNNMNTTMQGYTTATVTCTTQAPVVGIVWKTVVNVDFPPPSGVMHFGLPNSSTAGHILFPTKALYRK
jgi:Flp pilus assembly protein TadG